MLKHVKKNITKEVQTMKINQEKFNQLSQLDRIEFRQKENRINDFFNGSLLATFIYMFLFLFAFIFLAYIGLLNISVEIAKNFMIAILPIIKVMKIVFIVAFAFDLAICLIRLTKYKKLKEEFFDFKTLIKPKSKK